MTACVGPSIVLKTLRRDLVPRPFEIVQELEDKLPGDIDAALVLLRERARGAADRVRQRLFRSANAHVEEISDELSFSGYAFDQDEQRPQEKRKATYFGSFQNSSSSSSMD